MPLISAHGKHGQGGYVEEGVLNWGPGGEHSGQTLARAHGTCNPQNWKMFDGRRRASWEGNPLASSTHDSPRVHLSLSARHATCRRGALRTPLGLFAP